MYGILLRLEDAVVLYIGQTLNWMGAAGRLAQHLSESSGATLRQRLATVYNVTQVDGLSLEFAAVKLAERRSFWAEEDDYREAVESLVQHQLLNALCDRRISVCLISRVQPNPNCRVKYVMSEADRVFSSILGWIEACSQGEL